ncbi:MAG: Bacterial non-heme ferritin [Candidatus Anoxychlamydiales bacterium]|nr:Bacterial non-heme ferritin [Candidatus Anoxychlamydiales bacterium]
MLSKTIEKAFNDQLNKEFYSSYLYLSMSAYAESKNFSGMAHFLKLKAQEEREHALKIFDYIIDRRGTILLKDIKANITKFKSILDLFEKSYEHECNVTKLINNLITLTGKEKDYCSKAFLHWFAIEQIEEEKTSLDIVEKLKIIKSDGPSLYMLDKDLKSSNNTK